MRKMTHAEQEYLERTLAQRVSAPVETKKKSKLSPVNKPRQKQKRAAWKKVSNWAIGLLILPVGFTAIFFYGIQNVENILGKGGLQWLSNEPQDNAFMEQAELQGLSWLPEFLVIYDNRWLIIGAVFTITIIIIGIVMIIEHLITRKREGKNE